MSALAPVEPVRRNRSVLRRLLIVSGVVGLGLLALITLLIIGLEVGPVGLVTGLVVATVPVPLYVGLALWIDRFEPEPARMLAWAFFWGASAAPFIALVLTSVGQGVVSAEFGSEVGEIYGSSISAPVVEESAKAAVLAAIYRWRRSELNGVLDGIVYASMVGLGFAMTENVLYYGKAAVEDGVPITATFFLRGVLSPFAHPVFTSMTGIGLGIAVASARSGRRLVPIVGLLAAMALHSLWNTSATVGDGIGFVGVYFLIMIPIFVAVVVTGIVARRREGAMVRTHLRPELESGALSADDLRSLSSVKERKRAVREASRGGLKRVRSDFQDAATELAFLRHRVAKGAHHHRHGDPAALESALRGRMLDLRSQLPAAPAALPFQGAAVAYPAGFGVAQATAAAPPPGWYPDPWRQARLRYWDGRAWTGYASP